MTCQGLSWCRHKSVQTGYISSVADMNLGLSLQKNKKYNGLLEDKRIQG